MNLNSSHFVVGIVLTGGAASLSLQCRHIERNGVSNTGVSIICSTVYSGTDQRKHQSSASLAFVRGTIGDRWFSLTEGQ